MFRKWNWACSQTSATSGHAIACSLQMVGVEDAGKLLAGFHIAPSVEAHEPAYRGNNGFCCSPAFQILQKSLSWVESNPEPCWLRLGNVITRNPGENIGAKKWCWISIRPSGTCLGNSTLSLIKNNFFHILGIYKISICPTSHPMPG